MTDQGNPPPTPPGINEMLDTWRQVASDWEQYWNDYLNQVMGTEAFAQTMSRSMDSYLTMQAAFARATEQYLRALNLPTRTDITQLAERIGALEQRIDMLAMMLGAPPPAANDPSPRRTAKAGSRAKRAPGAE